MVTGTEMTTSANETTVPTAPWWHTLLILLVLAIGSVASAYQHGLAHFYIPGVSVRLAGQLTVLAQEWLIIGIIWLWLRHRGLPIGVLVRGRWQTVGAFFKDLGLAVGFLCIGGPFLVLVGRMLEANDSGEANIVPKTALEAVCWVVLSATAGFGEELTFRGYLMQQFKTWTKRPFLGIVLQGVAFGLAHGYQAKFIIAITLYGWLLGLFAFWRKSLRPVMLAHFIQDALGGLLSFFFKI